MIKKIKFVPASQNALDNIPPPMPAKKAIPEWYRAGEMFVSSETNKAASPKDTNVYAGMKSCVPFLDAMISGYFICSWQDYYVYTTNELEEFYPVEKNPYTDMFEKTNTKHEEMIKERIGDSGHTIPRPEGFCQNHMIFAGQWGVRLPRGWSLFLTHPQNRFDLPFFTTSGIIDSDEWWASGNIPFFFQKNYSGVIPKGTPFAQIIPLKRSAWSSDVSRLSVPRNIYMTEKARSVPVGWYKKNMWVKKQYD